jgi:hypothetical protein
MVLPAAMLVTLHEVPAADAYWTDHPPMATVLPLLLWSSMKSLV